MHLHDFLSEVHLIVQPKVYLEVGVQHGTSLARAHAAELAIGIDPKPLIKATGNQVIHPQASNHFFQGVEELFPVIDFGFIDGLHHFEQALRDFMNIERYLPPLHQGGGGVIVFDDVLPRNQEEASRVQCPGDWTGDVWKVSHILLRKRFKDLRIVEVNTQPTGTLLVYGFSGHLNWRFSEYEYQELVAEYMGINVVPDNVINRAFAVEPQQALDQLREYLCGSQSPEAAAS